MNKEIIAESDHYFQVSSAALKGSYGCDFWVSKSHPLGLRNDVGSKVRREDITVLLSQPRLLCVVISSSVLTAVFVVAHAPHVVGKDLSAWWAMLKEELLKLMALGYPLVLFIDANARSPCTPSDVFGVFGATHETKTTPFFRDTMIASGVLVPSTFEQYCSKESHPGTYFFSPESFPVRIDFLGASPSIVIKPESIGTLSMDLHLSNPDCPDHIPLGMRVTIPVSGRVGARKRRVAPYDREGVKDPVKVARFREMVGLIQPIPVAVVPTSHLHIISDAVRNAAVQAFPLVRKPKRQPYLSPSTYDIVCQRKSVLKLLSAVGRSVKLAPFRFVFNALRGRFRECHFCDVRGFVTKDMVMQRLWYAKYYSALSISYDSYSELDWLVFLETKDEEIENGLRSESSKVSFKAVKDVIPKKARGTSRLAGPDGKPATSSVGEQRIMRAHFSATLSGRECTLADLIDADNAALRASLDRVAVIPKDRQVVPSLPTLILKFARLKPKGVGEDVLGGELFSCAAHELAKLYHPLVVKASLSVCSPVQWKGGQLMGVYKGKGATSLVLSYRDVVLTDASAKAPGGILRTCSFPVVQELSVDTQFGGGFNNGSTAIAHLSLRAFIEVAEVLGLSLALLFVDVKSAFASVVRRLAVPIPDSDEQWISRLRAAGFTESDIADIWADALTARDWVEAGGSPHLLAVLSNLSSSTWLSFESLKGVVQCMTGTLAGTSLADVMFSLAFLRLLKKLRDTLAQRGLVWQVDATGAAHFFGREDLGPELFHPFDASYVDDLVIPIADTAGSLIGKVVDTTAVVVDIFSMFGFEVNFSKGKTEVLFLLRGVGADAVARHISHNLKGRIEVKLHRCSRRRISSKRAPPPKVVFLLATDLYKHVGTKVPNGKSFLPEVRCRMAIMSESAQPIRVKVLNNSKVPLTRRVLFLRALLFSRGFFQAATWPVLVTSEAQALHSGTMRVVRYVYGGFNPSSPSFVSDADVLKHVSLPAPINMLRIARVSLFFKVVSTGCPSLLNLLYIGLRAKRSWLAGVREDLVTAVRHSSSVASISAIGMSEWSRYVLARGCKGKVPIVKSLSSDAANSQSAWAFSKKLLGAGVIFRCDDCAGVFTSKQGLAVHRYRKHGWRHDAHLLVDVTHCPVCMVEFWHRSRILAHLMDKSLVCLNNLRLRVTRLPRELADELDAISKREVKAWKASGKHKAWASVPCVRLSGPIFPIIGPEGMHTHTLGPNRRLCVL